MKKPMSYKELQQLRRSLDRYASKMLEEGENTAMIAVNRVRNWVEEDEERAKPKD